MSHTSLNALQQGQLADLKVWQDFCLQDKDYYLNWGKPILHEALFGTQGGDSILICGAPNHGKSQCLTSISLDLMRHNSDIVLLDFTLDDTKRKRLTQYVANLARMPMNDVDFINKNQLPAVRSRYNDAVTTIRKCLEIGRLYIYEATGIDAQGKTIRQGTIPFLAAKVKELQALHPGKKLVITLDALNNIALENDPADDFVKARLITEQLENLLSESKAVLLATSHLRKNTGRRPMLEDLKGNNALAYAAKAVLGIFNDMKQNQGEASVCWLSQQPNGDTEKMPIVEAHFLKSKVSAFNGCIAYHHWPAWGKVEEAEASLQATYLNQIYGSVKKP